MNEFRFRTYHLGKTYIRIRTNIPGSCLGLWVNQLMFRTEHLG